MGSGVSRGRLLVLVLIVGLAAVAALGLLMSHGFSARDQPTALEAFAARRLRNLSIPRSQRQAQNPVPLSPEVLARAREHFADHCATCHGNDGRGRTAIGQSLYPKAPDMWLPDTQSLSDGALFSIIKNGVRLTGMPAWGEDTPEGDRQTWELVHFIRHLPHITAEELAQMEELNPKSRKQLEEDEATRRFLAGESPAPSVKDHKH